MSQIALIAPMLKMPLKAYGWLKEVKDLEPWKAAGYHLQKAIRARPQEASNLGPNCYLANICR